MRPVIAWMFLLPVFMVLLWLALTMPGLIKPTEPILDPVFLPRPDNVMRSLASGILSGTLLIDSLTTIGRSFAGFAIAALLGIPLGLIIGRVEVLSRALQPTIDFFRSVPATALFPLFSYAFGIEDKAKVAVVVYGCSLLILVNTAYGAMQVKQSRLLSARLLGASPSDAFWLIILPESAPGVYAGLRIALSMAFVLIVVTEMFIGTTVGLGHQIMTSQQLYQSADAYAAIVLTGLIGYAANRLVIALERRHLHWVGR